MQAPGPEEFLRLLLVDLCLCMKKYGLRGIVSYSLARLSQPIVQLISCVCDWMTFVHCPPLVSVKGSHSSLLLFTGFQTPTSNQCLYCSGRWHSSTQTGAAEESRPFHNNRSAKTISPRITDVCSTSFFSKGRRWADMLLHLVGFSKHLLSP